MELEARIVMNGGRDTFDWDDPLRCLTQDTIEHLIYVFSRRITTDTIHLISNESRVEVRIKYDNRRANK